MKEQDKQIEELTKQLDNVNVKSGVRSGSKVIGLWTHHSGKIVREVFEGPMGGIYYLTDSGNKTKLNKGDFEEMEEAEVHKRIAEHEAPKVELTVIGLHTSKDKQKVRAVFKGPKDGVFIITPGGNRTRVEDGEYEPMDEAEVNKRIEAHEAWLASSPTK